MKRILLLLPLMLLLTGCAIDNERYYQQAQLYLGSGDPTTAGELFRQLGEYSDAAEYALYCAGLEALKQGDLPLARANMAQVEPFKSSARYLDYIRALALEQEGELEDALTIYRDLGSFEGSHQAAARLMDAIPQRDLSQAKALMSAGRYQQALDLLTTLGSYADSASLAATCRDALAQASYDSAAALYQQGEYARALAAFDALGDTLDAKARVISCRSALYQELERDYRDASMATAAALMERYRAMDGYLESDARLRYLEARYATNLSLVSAVYARPYVRYADLTWRAVKAEGSHVTLLCQDALFFSTATDLPVTLEDETIVSFAFPQLVLDLDEHAFVQGTGSKDAPFE